MIYYKPKHFTIAELVSESVYDRFGEQAWMFFDPRILYTADRVRIRYGKPAIINNWAVGGNLENRGFRSPDCKVGAEFSDHKRAQAIDLNVVGITPEEIRVDILANPDCEAFKYITSIEMKVNWNHISTRNIDKKNNNIQLIYP